MAAPLDAFRLFVIGSTCRSFAPEAYIDDAEVFAEREEEPGAIYVEAADKVTLKKIRDITFVNARDVLGVIYNSKSGNTALRWRQSGGGAGRVTGEASTNSLTNLAEANVLPIDWVKDYFRKKTAEAKQAENP